MTSECLSGDSCLFEGGFGFVSIFFCSNSVERRSLAVSGHLASNTKTGRGDIIFVLSDTTTELAHSQASQRYTSQSSFHGVAGEPRGYGVAVDAEKDDFGKETYRLVSVCCSLSRSPSCSRSLARSLARTRRPPMFFSKYYFTGVQKTDFVVMRGMTLFPGTFSFSLKGKTCINFNQET